MTSYVNRAHQAASPIHTNMLTDVKIDTSATHEHSTRWQPIWSQIPANIVTLADYEHAARHYLPSWIKSLLFENNLYTKDKNADALDELYWQPHVLTPQLINLDCHLYNPNSAVVLDCHLPHPLWLSPVAHQGLYHPEAERATRDAAGLLNTPAIWSSLGNTPFEHLFNSSALPCHAAQWYWQPLSPSKSMRSAARQDTTMARRQYNLDLITDLVQKGMTLLVLTVDAPHSGVRAVSRREGAVIPEYCQCVNMLSDNSVAKLNLNDLLEQAPTWEDMAWLASRCPVPLFLKGIMSAQDAKRAQDIGCAGIIVSNHGRRVLSDVVPVAKVLPQIRQYVGSEMPIIADGGIRSGSDMAKLLALGADAVAIGRGYIYGLALAGALGVAHVNKILLEELQVTMAVLGVNNLTELTQDKLFNP